MCWGSSTQCYWLNWLFWLFRMFLRSQEYSVGINTKLLYTICIHCHILQAEAIASLHLPDLFSCSKMTSSAFLNSACCCTGTQVLIFHSAFKEIPTFSLSCLYTHKLSKPPPLHLATQCALWGGFGQPDVVRDVSAHYQGWNKGSFHPKSRNNHHNWFCNNHKERLEISKQWCW